MNFKLCNALVWWGYNTTITPEPVLTTSLLPHYLSIAKPRCLFPLFFRILFGLPLPFLWCPWVEKERERGWGRSAKIEETGIDIRKDRNVGAFDVKNHKKHSTLCSSYNFVDNLRRTWLFLCVCLSSFVLLTLFLFFLSLFLPPSLILSSIFYIHSHFFLVLS